jgi:hypothetical protein
MRACPTTLLASFLLLPASACAGSEPARKEPDFYLGGIQVNEADHQAWFQALRQESMNTVEITHYARQGDWDSDNLFWDAEAPWVLAEMRGARKAGLEVAFFARVALDHAFPRNAFLWHGMIQPKDEQQLAEWFARYTRFVVGWAEVCQREGVGVFMIGSEMNALASTLPVAAVPPLEAYFLDAEQQAERKRRTLAHRKLLEGREMGLRDQEKLEDAEHYLEKRIATEQGWAAQVSAGADAGAVEAINRRRALLQEHWLRLIAEVRKVYQGKIGYAANFDQYHLVGFWPQLDFMGINAYFKLRQEMVAPGDTERLEALLREGWRHVFADMVRFRAEQKVASQPVIFTELGYTWRAQSTLEPWSDTGFSLVSTPTRLPDGSPGKPKEELIVWREQPKNLEERAAAVRALYQAHSELEKPILRGILYWKLSSHTYHEEVESFLVHIGGPSKDPILPALRLFLGKP